MQLSRPAALLLAFAALASANVDSFQYYRHHNFDRSGPLSSQPVCYDRCDVSGLCSRPSCAQLVEQYPCDKYYAPGQQYAGWCDSTCGYAACARQSHTESQGADRMVEWNASYAIFDSPRPVHVTRFDLFNASADRRLDTVLALPNGPAYIFTTAPLVVMRDLAGNTNHTIYAEEAAWVSQASCLQLVVAAPAAGMVNASVLVVSSGELEHKAGSECKPSKMVIGYEDLHNNPVDYVVQGNCTDTLSGPGGAEDFDDLDSPIRPLVSHYHTRGALYYTANGVSNYNDPGEGPVSKGEMRFVQWGHFYGPETMWGDDYFVMSFHEADPSARSLAPSSPPSGFTPCAFACLDKPADGTPATEKMKCVLPSSVN